MGGPAPIAAVKGFRDVLPPESRLWQQLEATAAEVFAQYDFQPIALPLLERAELFARSLGEGTDVVEKEMYTFGDRDDMVTEAKRRIAEAPGTYVPEIYGLEEVGGTSVLHLSSVPFEQIGYITGLPKTPMPDLTHRWLRVTAPVFAVLYGVFGALNWIVRRRMRHQRHEGEHT